MLCFGLGMYCFDKRKRENVKYSLYLIEIIQWANTIRINILEYIKKFSISHLISASPGYVEYEEILFFIFKSLYKNKYLFSI